MSTHDEERTAQVAPAPGARDRGPSRQAWRTVALREVMVKLTDKAFIMGTLTSLLLVVAAIGLSSWVGERPQHTELVVTSAPAEQLGGAVGRTVSAADDKDTVTVTRVADTAAAEQRLRDGDADAWLTQHDGHWQLVAERGVEQALEQAVRQTLQQQTMAQLASRAGTSMGQVVAATTVETRQLEGDTSRSNLARAMGLVFGVLFMMSAMTFGMQIAQSVIEEKQSRIVEILVAAIPVRQLLAGKVLGNTVMALGQMAVLVVAGLLGASLTPMESMLPAMSGAIGWYLLFFLAGFLALACIWAAAGALCSRNEDLQQTSQPLIWLLMGCYLAGFLATGTARVVLSFVPVVSSVLMPVRLVEGSAAWWEPVVALVANLAFAAATVLVGEKVYRRALLQTGGRLTYRQALHLAD